MCITITYHNKTRVSTACKSMIHKRILLVFRLLTVMKTRKISSQFFNSCLMFYIFIYIYM